MKIFKIDRSTSNTFDGTTISSLSTFSINETGDTTTLGSDGHVYAEGAYVDNIIFNVTVNGYDVEHGLAVGAIGSLVLHAEERANGSEEPGTPNPMTFTFANSTLDDISENINHNGNSDVTFTFRCVSSDGSTSPLAIS